MTSISLQKFLFTSLIWKFSALGDNFYTSIEGNGPIPKLHSRRGREGTGVGEFVDMWPGLGDWPVEKTPAKS